MNQLCKVCGEPAAGYHFGAFTCEGCKSFFGRTYNSPNTIGDCKNNNQCIINKKNRTSCKKCRLKKCVQVGMSKNGSRYGRRSNWFKLHCLMDNQTNLSSTNTNGSLQINESFNENQDLVNQIKSEANLRENHVNNHVKNPTTNGINNTNNNNNNVNNNNNNINNNKSNIIKHNNKNSSTNNITNHNGNCNNHTLHNITNHSNVVLTTNGNKNQTHVSPGTHNSSSDGTSPLLTGSDLSSGHVNHLSSSYSLIEAAAKAFGFPTFDPSNSFMLHPHSDSRAGLKLAAAVAAAAQASSSKSSDQPHHLQHHHRMHSQFLHPLNVSSSSSSSPPIVAGQTSQINLSTSAIGSTITTPLSNSSSPSVTSNGTSSDNLTFPFHHHPHHHQLGSHPTHHGIPISPIAPMSPLDPSSRHLFNSAVQLFGKGFNVLPKELNNYLLSSAYTNRFFPLGSINQVSKLNSSSSISPSPNFLNIKGTPPSPSDIIYGNDLSDQERPIDLSRSSASIKLSNPHHSNKSKKQPRRATTRGSEDEEEEDPEEEDEDAELCLHDDNNNPTTGDEGSKSCMIGDHDSGFSPSSNEDNHVTTPLDLTAKKSPTPPPSAPPAMII